MVKNKGLRVLHAGDVYLGRPFPELPIKSSERRRKETLQTLRELLHYVEEQQIHLVLFSGNLFDFDYATYEVVASVMREMERMSFAQFVIAPGVSDRLDAQSFYKVCHLPANVHVFSEKAETLHLPTLGVNVFGWGLCDDQKDHWPMTKLIPPTENEILLICGCQGAGGKEGVRVTEEDIASSGAVYAALSGEEGFHGFFQVGGTVTAQSGLLESSSFSDEGFGGANLLILKREGEAEETEDTSPTEEQLLSAEQMTYFEVSDETKEENNQIEEEQPKPRMEFEVSMGTLMAERLLFGGRQYITESIDISGFKTAMEVEQAVCDLVRQKGYGADTSLCILLLGHTAPDFAPPRLRDHTAHGLAELLSVDKTVPDKDEREYIKDMSIRGELMRAMMPSILGGDEKNRENTIKALRIAFLALDNDG